MSAEDKRIIELPTATELESNDYLAIDNALDGTRKIRAGGIGEDFIGATAQQAGSHGLVPAPSAGDENKVLTGGATWKGVDASPTQNSTNLVQSGGVYSALASKADASAIPTDLADLADDSTHRLVTDAEKSTWNAKQSALTFDDVPTDGSNNPVKSNGIYDALATKANTSDLATVATSGSYTDLSNTPTIPDELADLSDDSTHRLVTDTEKAAWDAKANVVANPLGEATGELKKVGINNAIYKIVGGEKVYGEASGAIASFSDGSANPLADLKIAINPVQAGSGDPSPSNPRPISGWTGANVGVNGKNFCNIGSASFTRYKQYPLKLPAGTYTLSSTITSTDTDGYDCYFGIYDNSDNLLIGARLTRTTRTSNTFTLSTNSSYIILYAGHNSSQSIGDDATWADVQVEVGSLATTYTPYVGTTYLISWQTEAGEVFGGELDVTSGVLTVDTKKFDITSFSGIDTGATNPNGNIFYKIVSESNKHYGIDISNIFLENKTANKNNIGLYEYGSTSGTSQNFSFCLPSTIDTLEKANQWLSDNSTYIVSALATPITIQLTPTQVSSILGTNNIWADCGDSDVVCIRDLNLFLNQLDARVTALENA